MTDFGKCAWDGGVARGGSGSALSAAAPGVRPTTEMEGWVAEEWVYVKLRGAAHSGGTLGRGVAHVARLFRVRSCEQGGAFCSSGSSIEVCCAQVVHNRFLQVGVC